MPLDTSAKPSISGGRESLLIETLQEAAVGILLLDTSGIILFLNESLGRVLSVGATELIGRHFHDLIHVEDRARAERVMQRLVSGREKRIQTEIRYVRHDGSYGWAQLDSTAVCEGGAEKVSHLVVVSRDVTRRKDAERFSRVIESRFQAIYQSQIFGVFFFGRDGSIRNANDAFLRIFGYTRQELDASGVNWRAMTPEDWHEQDEHLMRQLAAGARMVTFFKEFFHRNGKRVPVFIGASLLGSDDEMDGIGFVHDLSELFEARSMAEESHTKASLALDAARIGIWEYVPSTGAISWDPRCHALFGLPPGVPIEKDRFLEVVRSEDRRRLKRAVLQALAHSSMDAEPLEIHVRTAKGERILSATGRAFFGTDGVPKRLIGTVVDITEAKLAEQKVFESEERFRTLAETIPQIVFIAQESGEISFFNGRWTEYSGLSTQESFGNGWMAGLHPEDQETCITTWNRRHVDGKSFALEARLRDADGGYRWHIIRAHPLREGSTGLVRWFGTCTDIDEQRRKADEMRIAKEIAERADRMKSSFLANMSHEIRTPLGAILGFTELLTDPDTDEREKTDFLQVIARNGRSLSRIVDDILDLSKVEAGLLQTEKVRISPRALVSDSIALFAERARTKGLWLDDRVSSNVPEEVISDPTRFRQILSNLISNAIKFTDRGGVFVEVTARLAPGEDRLVVKVRDTGIGIAKDQVVKLFQPFAQADDSMSRRFGGTGLGLHLSRRLAEALDGRLEIESTEPGLGSSFVLEIPTGTLERMEGVAPAVMEFRAARSTVEASLQGRSFLVVEDSQDNQLLIERLLCRRGARIDFAENGESGVERAKERDYDLILMDLQMPNMDGFEATERIRHLGVKTPIIALTAHVIDDVRQRCEQIGCSGFLSKPIHPPELMKAIREHLTI